MCIVKLNFLQGNDPIFLEFQNNYSNSTRIVSSIPKESIEYTRELNFIFMSSGKEYDHTTNLFLIISKMDFCSVHYNQRIHLKK